MHDRFPQQAALRDGRRVIIRRFEARDEEALYDFFQRLPPRVRQFAWDNIDDRGLVHRWARELDYGKVLPLVAIDGHRIVADATLHRRDHGPLRLVGRIKWLLEPGFRGAGLGTLLVNDLIAVARTDGLRHLSCMLIQDLETDAIATLRDFGFAELSVPGYGADPEGGEHDMVKLTLRL